MENGLKTWNMGRQTLKLVTKKNYENGKLL
jgi:hypothetical protein